MLNVRSEPKPDRFNVIIETPKDSRNKFSYEPESRMFKLGKQLPAGAGFPYDFGFIPATRAEDGDPIDVVVLLDTATFPGCLVRVRLVGVIDAVVCIDEREGCSSVSPLESSYRGVDPEERSAGID